LVGEFRLGAVKFGVIAVVNDAYILIFGVFVEKVCVIAAELG